MMDIGKSTRSAEPFRNLTPGQEFRLTGVSTRVFLVVFLLTVGIVHGDEPVYKGLEKLPDPATGEIDGQPAIVVWPVDKQRRELLDVKACQVILERHDTEEFSYLTYPCGKWFVPEIARYDMWVEMPGYVSDSVSVYAFGGGVFKGAGARSLHPVVPAGRIRAKAGFKIPAMAETFKVLSLRDQWVTYQRAVTAAEALNAVSAPTGRAIAGFFDASGNALTLTHPFEVKAGATIELTPVAPQNGSDLLLVIGKKGPSEPGPGSGLKVTAGTSAMRREPDVLLNSRDQLIAVWYGLTSESADVIAGPYLLRPVSVLLRSGKITTLRRSFVATRVTKQ